MPSLANVQKKIECLRSLLDSDKASDSLSGKECNEMGILCLRVEAIVNDFNRTGKTEKDLKNAYKSLGNIEREANKTLKKGGGYWKIMSFTLICFILYITFK